MSAGAVAHLLFGGVGAATRRWPQAHEQLAARRPQCRVVVLSAALQVVQAVPRILRSSKRQECKSRLHGS